MLYIKEKEVRIVVKRISVMVLALCLMLSVNANALTVNPMADSTASCIPSLYIRKDTAYCTISVKALNSSASITATITLLKSDGEGGFTVLYRWVNLKGTGSLDFSDTYTSSKITSGSTYRMEYSVRVVGSGGTDTINHYCEV